MALPVQYGNSTDGSLASCSMSTMGEVPPPERGNEVASSGALRASHEDRDRVVELLRVAAGDGRLTAEELDQRLEVAMTARTCGELATLTTDLPAAPALTPKDLARIDCGSAHTKRDGRWMVPRRMEVRVTSGRVTLDFTEAVIAWSSLQIDAEVRSGELRMVTRPGIVVDADDVAVRSGRVNVRTPSGHQVPVALRIDVSGKVSSGSITARPPRRTFWQWLRRRPGPYPLSLR
jgi:hypothetical protein